MAVVAVVIIIRGAMAVIMAVVAAAIAMAPGKGSGKNPKKSSPRKERGVPLRLLTRKGAQMGVIGAPFNTSPA